MSNRYIAHPLSQLFPMFDEASLDLLKLDIEANGQKSL